MNFIIKNFSDIILVLLAIFIYSNIIVFLVRYVLKLKEKVTKIKAVILSSVFVLVFPVVFFTTGVILWIYPINGNSLVVVSLYCLGIYTIILYFLAIFYLRLDKATALKFSSLFLSILVISLSAYLFYEKIYRKYDCSNHGGRWQVFSLGGGGFCNLPTSDAGKSCTDSSQCEKYCVQVEKGTNIGKCYEWKIPINTCLTHIENGKAAGFAMCAFE